ncbi:hypothetical protein N9C70_05165, partial [Flavobacteriales bacterium]|nr:hypothetical protein [Flavobacteriales bacterium]
MVSSLHKTVSFFCALFVGLTGVYAQQQVSVSAASAPEGYALEIEVVSEDIGVVAGPLGPVDLTGYNCTRLYVTMNNATDFMSSVSGDAINPTFVNTTTNFRHAELGGVTPGGISPVLYGFYPDLPYDSWVTIGLEQQFNAGVGEAAVAVVQSANNPWSTIF